jgi:hypothetical protein
LITFSLFVQIAEGSTFGIVPYLNPNATGSVAGIVGAGGNAGAVIFSILFRQIGKDRCPSFFELSQKLQLINYLRSLSLLSISFLRIEYRDAFFCMGITTSIVSLLSIFIWIKGYEGLFLKRRVKPTPNEIKASTTRKTDNESMLESQDKR